MKFISTIIFMSCIIYGAMGAKPTDQYKDAPVIRSAKPTDQYKDAPVIRSAKPTDQYKDSPVLRRVNRI